MSTDPSDTGILLESGTNEFEVLIFNISNESFGVNVAKVREIIMPPKVTRYPRQPKAMLGMINLRGETVPLISLHQFFNIENRDIDQQRQCIIVTEFSRSQSAFFTDGVEQIMRTSWDQIQPVPDMGGSHAAQVTGILTVENRLIPMVDFESIRSQLFPRQKAQNVLHDNEYQVDRSAHRVYVAEDSPAIRELIENTLVDSGYKNMRSFANGQACWDQIQSDMENDCLPDALITDIEMPLMDGLALTRRIKEDVRSKHVPVILFSSIISEDNLKKGEQVGADEQLAKPRIGDVVKYTDKWISIASEQKNSKKSAA